MMEWLEVTLHTTSEASEAIAEILMQLAAQGIATEDPDELRFIYENPDTTIFTDSDFLESLQEYVRIRAYFPVFEEGVAYRPVVAAESARIDTAELYSKEGYPDHRGSKEEFVSFLEERLAAVAEFLELGEGVTATRIVQDEDWAESWKQHYQPIRVSPRLTISPSWIDYTAEDSDERVLRLDPGSAFGTGDHPTTALCLRMLDQYLEEGAKAADVGCGSGVLAIGAANLGAANVDAVDIDPNAVAVARANAALNDPRGVISVRRGELKDLAGPYDVIAANLVSDLLLDLAGSFKAYLSDSGLLIVSGIVNTRAEEVRRAYEQAGFETAAEAEEKDWVCLVFR